MPPKRTLKFLALHGHAMNPHVFEKKIGAIRSEVKKLGCEFVFAKGPIIPPSDWMNPTTASGNNNNGAAGEKEGATTTTTTSPSNNTIAPDNINIAAINSPPPSESNINAVTTPNSDGAEEASVDTTTVYSWADFWTWKRNTNSNSPKYYGFDEAVKVLQQADAEYGPFDGILAFSQGTGVAALWLALEAQELRRKAEKIKNGTADDKAEENNDDLHVSDDIPLNEWRVPQSMHLLRHKPISATGGNVSLLDNSSTATTSSSSETTTMAAPFLLINVSGVIQRDDVFGGFVTDNLLSLAESQRIIAESNTTQLPLRPLHILNVYGTTDAVVLPETTAIMTNLYNEMCNTGRSGNADGGGASSSSPSAVVTADEVLGMAAARAAALTASAAAGKKAKKGADGDVASAAALTTANLPPAPTTCLAYGGNSCEWSHDGGHVVPAPMRKPLKAMVEALWGK